MNFHSDKWINDRVLEHYEAVMESIPENRIVGIFYYGSGNYGMDYKGSDVDTKCIVLPSFEDLALNKQPNNMEIVLENGEHIDIKDIRLMFGCFRKQNVNYLEILFTKYYILNSTYAKDFKRVLDVREEIAHYNPVSCGNCFVGLSYNKQKALQHIAPSTENDIKKYGYSPKNLHHILRISEFADRYIQGESFEDCLHSQQAEKLVSIKSCPVYPFDDVADYANKVVEHTVNAVNNAIDDKMLAIDKLSQAKVEEMFNETLLRIFKKSLTGELKSYE